MISSERIILYLKVKLAYINEGIFVHQCGYLLNLLQKYDIKNCNFLKVLMNQGFYLQAKMKSLLTNLSYTKA